MITPTGGRHIDDGSQNAALGARLMAMNDELAAADAIYQPSTMWTHLNALNTDQIERLGLERFKQSVNQNYFNWLPKTLADNQVRRVLRHWLRRPSLAPFLARMEAPLSTLEGFAHERMLDTWHARAIYRVFVAMLWDRAVREDRLGLLDLVEEPELGTPIRIRHRGRWISQDIANSAREANRLVPHLPDGSTQPPIVAELGAGYGRLGFVLVRALSCRYWVFDIPPALFIAEWYLSRVLPACRIFSFRPFDNFESIRDELSTCDVAFFTANQLALLPSASVDSFVNISSLHEMAGPQIDHYLQQMARTTRHAIYLKQWREFTNLADHVSVTRASYRLPDGWRIVHDAPDTVQDRFFELVARRD